MIFKIVNRSEVKSDILFAVNYYKQINPSNYSGTSLVIRVRFSNTF